MVASISSIAAEFSTPFRDKNPNPIMGQNYSTVQHIRNISKGRNINRLSISYTFRLCLRTA